MSSKDTLSDIGRKIGERFRWKRQKPDKDQPSMETIGEDKPPPSERPTRIEMEAVKEKEEIAFESGIDTTPSEKHPEHNEDAFISNSENGLYGVCDGVGGQAAGETASHEAAAVINKELGSLPINSSAAKTEKVMRDAIQKAHKRIEKLVTDDRESCEGMGTTVSIMKFAEAGKKLVIGQIGDSRIYRLRAGQLERISPEDSLVETAREYGFIDSDEDVDAIVDMREVRSKFFEAEKELRQMEEAGQGDKKSVEIKKLRLYELLDALSQAWAQYKKAGYDLGPQIAIKFFRNRISNVLNEYPANPHILTLDVQEDDVFLVCSDGISDNETDREIKAIIEQPDSVEIIARNLTKTANERASDENHSRAKKDDKTAIVVKVKKVGEAVKLDQRQKIKEISTKEEQKLITFRQHVDKYELKALRQIMQTINQEIVELENQLKAHPDDEILKTQLEYKRKWGEITARALREKSGKTVPSKKQKESF